MFNQTAIATVSRAALVTLLTDGTEREWSFSERYDDLLSGNRGDAWCNV